VLESPLACGSWRRWNVNLHLSLSLSLCVCDRRLVLGCLSLLGVCIHTYIYIYRAGMPL
jgi:hypothetical protein